MCKYVISIGTYHNPKPHTFAVDNTLANIHKRMRAKGYSKIHRNMYAAYYENDDLGYWARVELVEDICGPNEQG